MVGAVQCWILLRSTRLVVGGDGRCWEYGALADVRSSADRAMVSTTSPSGPPALRPSLEATAVD
jgi:hypothetical protein